MYQYLSKWRNEWIDFTPTHGQLIEMKKYHYQIRIALKGINLQND